MQLEKNNTYNIEYYIYNIYYKYIIYHVFKKPGNILITVFVF